MRPNLSIITIVSCCCLLINQGCLHPPNVKAINEDLGIRIPKERKLVQNESDPFGPGADAGNVYAFKFEAKGYAALEQSIEKSILFNFATEKQFDSLSRDKKLNVIKTLADNKLTSYWIRSDSDYVFDGMALIINEPDRAYKDAADNGFYLPNLDKEATWRDGTPIPVYEVKAKLDRKKRILYYKYVHI